jgi:hypothetical protein
VGRIAEREATHLQLVAVDEPLEEALADLSSRWISFARSPP